ncbi:MAG: hypothetical protein IPO88_23805 [Nannocystis sp.]|uniref:hypothetical protein n=1 Tax=Nannocystis sp. TaxID=1962667 RepID=UPI0024269394|nr:hypothetical protein [Nannocystis sp.]MBK9756466.1 hypothetical protein [Nannocystis sp.]
MNTYNGFRRWIVGGVIAAAATFSQQARADVPQVVTHQGRLFDAQGDPVVGAQDITFVIYDSEINGLELWARDDQRRPRRGLLLGAARRAVRSR